MGGDDAEPAAAAKSFKLDRIVRFQIPYTVGEVAVKHTVIARSHISATSALWKLNGKLLAGSENKSAIVRIKNILHD